MIDLSHLRLAQLGFGVRVGLSLFLAMIAAGYGAGAWYIVHHVGQKDGEPGLSWIDLEATYHGVDKPAELLTVLERPEHRAYLASEAEHEALVKWLRGGDQGERIGGGDAVEAGYIAEGPQYEAAEEAGLLPYDILKARCVSCHAPGAAQGDGIGNRIPLHDLPSVKRFAYRKKLDPLSPEILAVSSHTHFLSVPTFALLVFGLLLLTGWPRLVRHGLFALAFLGLAADFAGMWLARLDPAYLVLVPGGGAIFGGCLGLAFLFCLLELWVSPYLRGARQPPEGA